MRDATEMINGWDIAQHVGYGVYVGTELGRFNTVWKNLTDDVWKSWAEVEDAHPDVPEWVCARGSGSQHAGGWWYPADLAAKVELAWHSSGKPVSFQVGRPCEIRVLGVGRGSTSHLCGRPVKGTLPEYRAYGETQIDFPVCGQHLAVARRRVDADAAYQAEREERRRADELEDALNQASEDWAARLAELGVVAEGARCDDGRLRVEAAPEPLYALLVAAAGLLRDVGVPWEDVVAAVPSRGMGEVDVEAP